MMQHLVAPQGVGRTGFSPALARGSQRNNGGHAMHCMTDNAGHRLPRSRGDAHTHKRLVRLPPSCRSSSRTGTQDRDPRQALLPSGSSLDGALLHTAPHAATCG